MHLFYYHNRGTNYLVFPPVLHQNVGVKHFKKKTKWTREGTKRKRRRRKEKGG
jgi:hypothetical protein